MAKQCKLLLFLMGVLLLSSCGRQTPVTLHDIQGQTINFSQLQGKWVVINYWASWCKPCRTEIPELNNFYNSNRKTVIMLGVNYDQVKGSELSAIITKMGVTFPTLKNDPAQLLGLGDIPGLPATYIFNPQGKLSERLLGVQNQKTLKRAIGMS